MAISYALIGCGRIAPNHLAAAHSCGLSVRALCDTEPCRAFALADRFALRDVHIYNDYRTMLHRVRPILTAVATPSGTHAAIALNCMAAASNVLLEKPVALCLQDADRLLQAQKKYGVTAGVCHQNRFNPAVLRVREALEAGRFGTLLYATVAVRWNRDEGYYRQAPWRGTWEQDGGALMNQCIHAIDLLRWMMGDEVEAVCALCKNFAHPQIAPEDVGLALVRFANGSFGLIEGTTAVYPENWEETLTLFGTHGTAQVGGKSLNRLQHWRFADAPLEKTPDVHENLPGVYGAGHTPLYRNALRALQEGAQPAVPLLAGRRALELVLAIYRSAQQGAWVPLPLVRGDTLDFAPPAEMREELCEKLTIS